MPVVQGQMIGTGRRIAVVVSRWNQLITKELLEGALEALMQHGVEDALVVHVPGTWEIPPVAAALIHDQHAEAVVALGCILQGQTAHGQMLAHDVGQALMALQTQSRTPVTWGILVPENEEQAMQRSGLKLGNKGREAALAAIEMASVMEQLRGTSQSEEKPAVDEGVI